jgi:hypothetical protein
MFCLKICDACPFVSDPVEFSTASDRRTGKPIAVNVTCIDVTQGVPSTISDELFVGTVIQEAKKKNVIDF